MKYTTVIGLEIHAELLTKSKVFCGCKNSFGGRVNGNCCPVCAGMPGTLPALNKKAVELAVAAGLSFGCAVSRLTVWDRKNYFYPDLAKAYQISQLYAPVCLGGGLETGGRFIRLTRIHLEEDAGKLTHTRGGTLIDYNRAGVPLIEIVTEPDMRSADEAVEFVENVRRTLVYAGVSDGKMEQGSLRVDANISVMPSGTEKFGTRTEIKNLNSFKFIKKAVEFEAERQAEVLDGGGAVAQETRRYDEASGETFSMRSKEDAHDYRYFPDPDIPPVVISDADVERIKNALPETPSARLKKYAGYGLSVADAGVILENKPVSDFYDACVKAGADPVAAANLIRGEILRRYNASADREQIPVAPADIADALKLAEKSEIDGGGLKTAVGCMYLERKPLSAVLAEKNLFVKEDLSLVSEVVKRVVSENPKAAAQYKEGDAKVLSFFIGQCARALRGGALAQTVRAELERVLNDGD
ncbi:MAG: Asp-tRNA(Asn)/Glu-tRNA(Gln) amidotransferase subunit GatB [Clostridiales bacterium]|jgi:aspartyl-tRNA(Asn)/glutamyl-tRNA(Gln) amidotransferase subunit B|nr:Asp-tRNA(Asn)/Glu-tRNA(Gln) amidotransferase subunit GatB [Clostridiales bacterium]